jgi:hypothetical protein
MKHMQVTDHLYLPVSSSAWRICGQDSPQEQNFMDAKFGANGHFGTVANSPVKAVPPETDRLLVIF